MRIPRHTIDAVRDGTDIVEVVSRFVKLSRGRRDFKGLCPFHQEKTPSFHVVPDKRIYHCFGCQAGGDVFRFMMEIEGLSFIEAVKELAGPAGVTIEERELTPDELARIKARADAYDVLEAATQFFETTLWTRPEGAPGRAYLEDRGLDAGIARTARVGFAPDEWSTLLDAMHRQGYSPNQLAEVGLAKTRQSGSGYYDTFRNRVLFPIRDERSRVIAFGGRLLDGEGPKYLNTPETRLYNKSSVLYGLDMARQSIQKVDRAIIVEGYFDVLAMHQAGIQEAVATCGTALTREHLEKLRRMSRNLILLLDADTAGARAAAKSLPLVVEAGMSARRLQLDGGKDPDELVREKGVGAMLDALEHTTPLIQWVVEHELAKVDDPVAIENLLNDLLPVLVELPGDLISLVARSARMHEATLLERVRQQRQSASRSSAHQDRPPWEEDGPPMPPQPPPGWKPTREMVHVLWLLVHCYDKVADVVTITDPMLLDDNPDVRAVVARLAMGDTTAAVLEETRDDGIRRTLSAIVARAELYKEPEARFAMCQMLDKLGRPRREARLARLTVEVKDAGRKGDREAMASALRDQADLRARIRALSLASRQNDVDAYVRLLEEEGTGNAASNGEDP